MRKLLLALFLVLCAPFAANAATCTWSGGTGNWDNSNTASWSCGHVPTSADIANFDGSSGGGIVTVCGASSANCPNGSGTVSIGGLSFGAFTGTLDFATNNPSVTIAGNFTGTGTATRTLNMGNGVWTMVGNAFQWNFLTTTNLTLNINSSSIVLQATGGGNMQFFGGGKTWGALTIDGTANAAGYVGIEQGGNANNTFASCVFKAPGNILLRGNQTQTCTGGFTTTGTSATSNVFLATDNATSSAPATLAVGVASVCNFCAFRGITGATSSITATNSFSLGGNGGTLSISAPTGGGGGYIIGGQ